MSTMPDPVPHHTYETTEGTEPTRYGQHEPRTVAHTVTVGDRSDLHSMMTEIGDGTFVAWSDCRACRKHITRCTCANGPVEPEYMKPWRDKRFKASLNERPDPEIPLLGSVIEWVKAMGYTVTKDAEAALAEEKAEGADREPLERPSTAFERPEGNVYVIPAAPEDEDERDHRETGPGADAATYDPETGAKVDEGLSVALEKVREAQNRDTSDIDIDF